MKKEARHQKVNKLPDVITNLREGNIGLILDSYDDIFSDFDPRDYSQKTLSDDFLNECKKAVHDKKDKFGLRLLIPKKRNLKEEVVIRRRLKEHFERHFIEKKKELNKIKISGFLWFILGTLIILAGTFLYIQKEKDFLYTLLFVISEPASWFFFWEGLDKIFITSRKGLPEFIFYKKMAKSEIYFLDY